jgi:hypothetical protein
MQHDAIAASLQTQLKGQGPFMPTMIEEVGDQFFDNNRQPRGFGLRQPTCRAETRGGLDRAAQRRRLVLAGRDVR